MADFREQILRAGTDAEAWRAALFLVFTSPVNDADPRLVERIREVESLVRQRDRLASETARTLQHESIGTSEVANEAGISSQYVSKLRHGHRIGHAKTVAIYDAACRIVAARNQVGQIDEHK